MGKFRVMRPLVFIVFPLTVFEMNALGTSALDF
jgi:hypothetical protein